MKKLNLELIGQIKEDEESEKEMQVTENLQVTQQSSVSLSESVSPTYTDNERREKMTIETTQDGTSNLLMKLNEMHS